MTKQGSEVEILLGLAGTFRRVPSIAMAAALHIPPDTLRAACARLVLSLLDRDETTMLSAVVSQGGVGEGSDGIPPNPPTEPSVRTVRTVTVTPKKETVSDGTVPSLPSEPSDTPARETPPARALTAEALALTLGDMGNLAFYRALAQKTDPALIERALAETLSRRDHLRGRPGAYFTAVVRRLTRSSHPYV